MSQANRRTSSEKLIFDQVFVEMVRLGGLEPPTSGATILRSNQLSYNRISIGTLLAFLGVTYEG
jgi:hypothetical protein